MSTYRLTVVVCDQCFVSFESPSDYAPAARKAAAKRGWSRARRDGATWDLCPDCTSTD